MPTDLDELRREMEGKSSEWLRGYCTALATRLERAEQDTRRLDILEALPRPVIRRDAVSWLLRADDRAAPGSIVSRTLREAIDKIPDAAMKTESPEESSDGVLPER